MARAFWRDLTTAPASFAGAALIVVATYVSVVAAGSEAGSWAHAATTAGQLLLPAALGSAVCLCIACRLYPRDGVAWLAAATTVIGVQSLPTLGVADGDSPLAAQAPIASAVVLGLALLLLVKMAERWHLRLPPIPVGVGIGLLLILVRTIWSHAPSATLRDWFPAGGSATLETVGWVLLLGVGVVLALTIARRSVLPKGHKRIVVAALLWPVPQALDASGRTGSPGWAIVAIGCGLATCVLLASAALDLLWQAVRDDEAAVRNLQKQLLAMRDQTREGIEQLHEVKGTIAGIASATDLIRHEDRLSHQHRERLEELLATETQRLLRLVHTEAPDVRPSTMDLADVIRPLVLARRIQGQDVSWNAPSFPVRGEGDDLAEASTSCSRTPPSTRRAPRSASSPGVVTSRAGRRRQRPRRPRRARDSIFDWGYSQPGSTGQGVGLALAQRLLEEHGRSIRLDREHRPGAAFVIGLGRHAVDGSHSDTSVLAG